MEKKQKEDGLKKEDKTYLNNKSPLNNFDKTTNEDNLMRINKESSEMLKGLLVIELEGYLPLSFMGKMLKDLGAEIILIKQIHENKEELSNTIYINHLEDGKKQIFLNLKIDRDILILKKFLDKSDILIEGYRPGVLEKMNLDPKDLLTTNEKLIILRMTGYGQEGKMSKQPGHEINYLSLSGALDQFRTEDNKIVNPDLIVGDLFCGSLMPIYHLSQALLNRKIHNTGCIIDTAITTNLMSMNLISNKFVDNDNFYFSCVTKNYEYLLFYYKNNEKLNYYLKLTCERLIIETINLSTISEGTRLTITRDYIDFFELITKSVSESIKYIKDLCRKLTKEEIIKNLQKSKYVEVYPIIQNRDIYDFLQEGSLLKKENIKNPFKFSMINNKNERIVNSSHDRIKNPKNLKDIFHLLKEIGIDQEDIEYIDRQNLKAGLNPKL